MNKTELITFLRDPNRLSSEQLEELEAIVNENPYFLSARLLLAKASKEQKHPQTKKRVASAAIYSTDRVLFKKYLNGNLFFLSEPPKPEAAPEPASTGISQPDKKEESTKIPIQQKGKQHTPESRAIPISEPQPPAKTTPKDPTVTNVPVASSQEEKSSRVDKRPSAITKKTEKKQLEVPELPSGDLDSILEELQQDMANLKVSREKFTEVQKKIEEDDAVSAALEKASTKEAPKSEIPLTTPTPPTIEEKEVEATKTETTEAETSEVAEAKRSASEITMQILEAAKKAKEEVAQEDVAKEEKAAKEKVEEEEKSAQPSEVEAKADTTKEESNDVKKVEEEKDESNDSGRAERVIREPRFSRFASRSYLKPPEEIPEDFLDEDKNIEKEKPKEDKEKKKESSSEIKLPDLSKAKPVARRSRPKRDKSAEEDADAKTAKKEEAEAKVTEDKSSETKKPAEKKSTTKTTSSSEGSAKTTEKKTTAKKATPTKKKTTEKKVVAKETEEKKAETKKTTAKKTTTVKKAAEKKPATKKTTEKKPVAKKTTEKKATTRKSATTTKKEGTKTKSRSATKSKSETSKKDKDDDKGDRKAQEDIIDKFIKESPTIKYQRKESTDTEDLSEESSAWDPNLASEYLAEIYLHQGNKKRAIEIYEALSLKYPEKKSYFADLISKIE